MYKCTRSSVHFTPLHFDRSLSCDPSRSMSELNLMKPNWKFEEAQALSFIYCLVVVSEVIVRTVAPLEKVVFGVFSLYIDNII